MKTHHGGLFSLIAAVLLLNGSVKGFRIAGGEGANFLPVHPPLQKKHSSFALYALFGDRTPRNRLTNQSNDKPVSGARQKSPLSSKVPKVQWEVYVDQSKASIDKGGSATLDAFIGLAPSSVQVNPAILPKSKLKGPVVRCISTQRNKDSLDIANVDSVDKVYRILTRHMKVQGVSTKVCECLKWKYKANGHLEAGKATLAIDAYDNALATGVAQQEGIILLMRATAYLKRAESHKEQLEKIVTDFTEMVPDVSKLQALYEEAEVHPTLANSIFPRVIEDTNNQEKQFRRTQYRHGLYQYALLQAAQDSLRATQLLPTYATSWLRAGEILSELWKLKESAQYYERAIELDESLEDSLIPVIDRLRKRQELLDNARAYGWSEDALRLALDVAG